MFKKLLTLLAVSSCAASPIMAQTINSPRDIPLESIEFTENCETISLSKSVAYTTCETGGSDICFTASVAQMKSWHKDTWETELDFINSKHVLPGTRGKKGAGTAVILSTGGLKPEVGDTRYALMFYPQNSSLCVERQAIFVQPEENL